MRTFVALAVLAGLAAAAPVPKALKKKNTSDIVGTWKPDKGSEWFQFDAEGNMTAWTNGGNAVTGAKYTYALDADPDVREWRMTWNSKGQPKPSYQVVYLIDGDRMYMTYSGATGQPMAKPDPTTAPNFTRQPADK